jgi:hypothetical protein
VQQFDDVRRRILLVGVLHIVSVLIDTKGDRDRERNEEAGREAEELG